MTINLLLNSEGKKMGKTEKGAVWLDAEKTSPFDFFQYWRNVADSDVVKCLKMLTFVPMDEIRELEKLEGSELNKAKELLAFELTKLVHGEEEANKALEGARALFSSKSDTNNMPSTELDRALFADGKLGVIELLAETKLVPSKAEARRLIQQGGISIDDQKITDVKAEITTDAFDKGYVVIKKGKKIFHKAILKDQ